MKRVVLVLFFVLALAGYASGQITSPTGDVLGAHNVYGRGCVACHAPHSGAAGNGGKTSPNSGNLALWGQDLSPLYGQTFTFAGGAAVTIPNYGTTVFNPPTLLGNDTTTPGNYQNDHPVGQSANPGCGGPYNWDCVINADGSFSFTGPASSKFLTDYFDVTVYGPIANLVKVPGTKPGFGGAITSLSWITCTTCHDQHDMQYFNAGPALGIKKTHFFVRGWYDPGNTPTSNSAAQFCRSCHGGESNEMHGQAIPTS